MKHLVPAIFWIIFSFLMISVSQAQSKKQLRQELARLEVKLNELQRENQKLLHQKEDLEQELFTKQELNRFLQREIARLREEIDATNSKYEALSAKLDQFEQQYALEAAPSRPPRVAITPAVEVSYAQVNEPAPLGLPRAKETGCAYLSDRLQNNQSYSLDYEPQPANRWGVQVFAFTSLCQAEKRARDFAAPASRSTNLYPTQGGEQPQAVRGGIWRLERQPGGTKLPARLCECCYGPNKSGGFYCTTLSTKA
ncbi:MAG: hypothetical protein D6730_25660 [Bacteroidetes bacterium]|nr:MAG: hypothetical protein D6730_25660 [Bacteroidota bacterium]